MDFQHEHLTIESTLFGPIGGLNCEALLLQALQQVPWVVSIVRLNCTSTGPIGGLNRKVLL